MEDKVYLLLRNLGSKAIKTVEQEIVEERIRAVYERLGFDDTEVEKELDECAKELLVCYRLKRRLNEYVEKHIYGSQNSPSI